MASSSDPAPAPTSSADASLDADASPAPPPLSPQDFHTYNHMAEMMDRFHNHFRHTWEVMHHAARTGRRPPQTSIRQYLALATQFCRQLTLHHTIEEEQIFPVLAPRMPVFRRREELLTQHERIHEGVERLEGYVDACRDGTRELRMEEVREILDSFGEVLWAHLDEEVRQLGAENMRRYWSREEMKMLPM